MTEEERTAAPGPEAPRRRADRGTRVTRVLAYGLGALLLAGVVVLAAAGVPAATAIVVTAAAVIVMIGLGSILGGRRTPPGPPVPLYGPDGRRADLDPGPAPGAGTGTGTGTAGSGGPAGPSTGGRDPNDTMEG